jgi:hypothetical protein
MLLLLLSFCAIFSKPPLTSPDLLLTSSDFVYHSEKYTIKVTFLLFFSQVKIDFY